MAQNDLIFFENRSTPKVMAHGKRFDPPESYGKVTKRRRATQEEEQWLKDHPGEWLQVDENGNKPGDDGYKKTRLKGREHLTHSQKPFDTPDEMLAYIAENHPQSL